MESVQEAAARMLDAEGDGCIVASAGGGKTTSNVTLHAAAEMRGVRAIVVTFTNATVADYIKRANRVVAGLASHDNVFTFHKLAHRVFKELGSDAVSKTCADTVVALALEELRSDGAPASFEGVRIILVDESQDCSRENFDLVGALADVLRAKLVLVGDANQNIYRFRNASAEFLVAHDGRAACTHTLGFNYRSTPAIIDMSCEFMRHPIDVSPGGDPVDHGSIPTLTLLPPRDVVSRVTEDAGRLLAAGNTVMLLAKSKRPRYMEGAVVRMGLQSFVNHFERIGVANKRLFREVSEEGSVVDGGNGLSGEAINVATIHGSKGLEADAVPLVDVVEEEESEDL
jgi:superfamily I DNA/RNA helicase